MKMDKLKDYSEKSDRSHFIRVFSDEDLVIFLITGKKMKHFYDVLINFYSGKYFWHLILSI